jgi:hypothetical protein
VHEHVRARGTTSQRRRGRRSPRREHGGGARSQAARHGGVFTHGPTRERGGERQRRGETRVGKRPRVEREVAEGRDRARGRRGWCTRGQSGGGSQTVADCGGRPAGGRGGGFEVALGLGGKGNGRHSKRRERREASEQARGITPARGRAGHPTGVEATPPRGRPTGGRGCTGKMEGGADTRAQGRGEGLTRPTGGAAGKNRSKNKVLVSKFKNCYFPGSKIFQIFTGAISHYQEHNATTNTQKAIKVCSQKFQQSCSFQNFQEFYGSR